ncbi:MAG: DHA2 family efflux MFS transporter permease subunit [Pseudobdellovibrionaceae bacterium]
MKSPNPLIIFVAVLASLLEIIDTSIVNVALSSMMGNLGATLEDISMVITGYAIANAIVLPISAWFSERIGRRKYFLGCIAAFTLTSVACGLAPNLWTLIVFRILQGLFGGALLPTSQTLIYEQFPKEKAGIAGAIFGMSVMVGPTLGPVMGGYLTDNFGWRSIFNINLPLGIIALMVGMGVIFDRTSQEGEESKEKSTLDWVGFALLVLGIGCLQYVLERGEADDWFSSAPIIINSLISAVCIPGFIWWELKVPNPIINLRLFLNPLVQNGVMLMGCLGVFLYSLVFILPIFVGRVFHYDATQVGSLFIPGSILTALMMPFIGKQMVSGTSPKILIAIGFISLEVCLWMMSGLSPMSSRADILQVLYIRGFGMAFLFVPINSSILGQFKGADLGQVSGLLNLFRQLGGSIGVAMVGTLLSKNIYQNYADLSNQVSLLNPTVQATYYQSLQGMATKMSGAVGFNQRAEAAIKSLWGRVQNQAFMMSFLQLVFILMFVVAMGFIPLYRIKLKSGPTKIVDAH